MRSDGLNRIASCPGQTDARTPDLIPGQRITTGDLLEQRSVLETEFQRVRFTAPHGKTSRRADPFLHSGYSCTEFLASFVARTTTWATSMSMRPTGISRLSRNCWSWRHVGWQAGKR